MHCATLVIYEGERNETGPPQKKKNWGYSRPTLHEGVGVVYVDRRPGPRSAGRFVKPSQGDRTGNARKDFALGPAASREAEKGPLARSTRVARGRSPPSRCGPSSAAASSGRETIFTKSAPRELSGPSAFASTETNASGPARFACDFFFALHRCLTGGYSVEAGEPAGGTYQALRIEGPSSHC